MLKRLPVLFLCAFVLCAPAFSSPVIDYGSEWKYFLGTSEASDPDLTAWRLTDFDDSSWLSGPTPTGYANPANSPSEANLVTFIPSISLWLPRQRTPAEGVPEAGEPLVRIPDPIPAGRPRRPAASA